MSVVTKEKSPRPQVEISLARGTLMTLLGKRGNIGSAQGRAVHPKAPAPTSDNGLPQ